MITNNSFFIVLFVGGTVVMIMSTGIFFWGEKYHINTQSSELSSITNNTAKTTNSTRFFYNDSLKIISNYTLTSSMPKNKTECMGLGIRYLKKIQKDFNEYYEKNLSLPNLIISNKYKNNLYDWTTDSIILNFEYFYYDYPNMTLFNQEYFYDILEHEFCHHFQNKLCRFGKGGESFCEIFAGRLHDLEYCLSNDIPTMYCSPFAGAHLKDSKAFVDCVVNYACKSNGADEDELDRCYTKWS